MSTRERTSEYAALRAIGFQPRHVVGFVVGEGFAVALLGATLGLGLAAPLLGLAGDLLSKTLGSTFSAVRLDAPAVAMALGTTLLGGMLAAAIPAMRAGRMKIVDALRRVD
jgi:putative ABC transport system permease protein